MLKITRVIVTNQFVKLYKIYDQQQAIEYIKEIVKIIYRVIRKTKKNSKLLQFNL